MWKRPKFIRSLREKRLSRNYKVCVSLGPFFEILAMSVSAGKYFRSLNVRRLKIPAGISAGRHLIIFLSNSRILCQRRGDYFQGSKIFELNEKFR